MNNPYKRLYRPSILSAKDLPSAINLLKLVFMIPNLFRFKNKQLPHGSYRNRGNYARYMKVRGYKKIKRQWSIR